MEKEDLERRLDMIEELYKTKFEFLEEKFYDLEQLVMLIANAFMKVTMPSLKEEIDKKANEVTKEMLKTLSEVAPEGSFLGKMGRDDWGYDPTNFGGK